MSDAMRAALAAKHVRDMRDIDVHRTRAGHWHPPGYCSHRCPMAGPYAAEFARALARAAHFPDANRYR